MIRLAEIVRDVTPLSMLGSTLITPIFVKSPLVTVKLEEYELPLRVWSVIVPAFVKPFAAVSVAEVSLLFPLIKIV